MRKPFVPSECCSSFSRSRSKASEPFVPLISQLNAFLRPAAKRVASIVPRRRSSNSTTASNASSTSRPGMNVRVEAETGVDLADEIAREVDHVRAEVAERARARFVLVEAPGVVRRRPPLLQVPAAEVEDVAELTRFEHLAREPHGRDEAVVERGHVLHARSRRRAATSRSSRRRCGRAASRRRRACRPQPRRSSARRAGCSARCCRTADVGIGDELVPVGHVALEAVARRRLRRRPPRRGPRSRRAAARSGGGQAMYDERACSRSRAPCP